MSKQGTTHSVTITEIRYDGVVKRTESDEYIEITNQGTDPADISKWHVVAGTKQEFHFPAGTTLAPRQGVRVYTDEIHSEFGGFSFGSGRSVWSNKGGVGQLFNAAGEQVSTFPYGDNVVRDIPDVLREQKVPFCTVSADARSAQEKLSGSVSFLSALERAIKSLIEDPADGANYTAATAVKENWDNAADADAATISGMIREHINGQTLTLLTEETLGDASESVSDTWIFKLREGMGDLHYIYVDRNNKKAPYQEIT